MLPPRPSPCMLSSSPAQASGSETRNTGRPVAAFTNGSSAETPVQACRMVLSVADTLAELLAHQRLKVFLVVDHQYSSYGHGGDASVVARN